MRYFAALLICLLALPAAAQFQKPEDAVKYRKAGMTDHLEYNFVMGVASGMPVDANLLQLLVKYREPGCVWQTTLIGREEIWAVHQATAELGGMLRTGLEDTFYLPGGERARGNGVLIEALL